MKTCSCDQGYCMWPSKTSQQLAGITCMHKSGALPTRPVDRLVPRSQDTETMQVSGAPAMPIPAPLPPPPAPPPTPLQAEANRMRDDAVKTSQGSTIALADAKTRKAVPLFSGVLKYFPDALLAVAELSRIGNDQHNPGQPLHWSRGKSNDHHDCLMRHLIDAGTNDTDNVRHSTKVAWRALAALQLEIEAAVRPEAPHRASESR